MTLNQHSESKRSVYDTCDPAFLRELREVVGMDLFVLARTACLSVAQVRQLESNEDDSLFYTDSIKRQAYKRVLMILGAEPPTVEVPEALRDAHQVADAHLNTLNQIVAMSEHPPMTSSTSDALRVVTMKLMTHKQALGALLFLLVSVVLFVFHGPQSTAGAEEHLAGAALPVSAVLKPTPVPIPNSEPVVSVPVAVASLPAVAAVPVVAASANAASASSSCAYTNDVMPQLSPFVAHKEGRYVYFVSTTNVELCVVDGTKQATTLQMKAGENRSVYGSPPWQVLGANLQKIQIYFQGGRVTVPDGVTNRVTLVEIPVTH